MENELLFTKTHEWIKWLNEEKTEAYIGLSKYATENLGDIVYVNIDKENVEKGEQLGDIESVKAVSDLFSPFTGLVSQVNEKVLNNPGLINVQPEDFWICKIVDIKDSEELFTKEEYDKLEKE
ncbi:MAG: glycine cleavage system protein H [Spirochaetaceae bacterium]|nr:glycine cleavage system protein H [Spirochaetaceae bacterium]